MGSGRKWLQAARPRRHPGDCGGEGRGVPLARGRVAGAVRGSHGVRTEAWGWQGLDCGAAGTEIGAGPGVMTTRWLTGRGVLTPVPVLGRSAHAAGPELTGPSPLTSRSYPRFSEHSIC